MTMHEFRVPEDFVVVISLPLEGAQQPCGRHGVETEDQRLRTELAIERCRHH